mmetsp:Transcript_1458/g.2216  ORF Transcript_1458/g.2216 Transcript_1458/m.2216 type:complete len:83 (-) Transcript_1458:159-407(-)
MAVSVNPGYRAMVHIPLLFNSCANVLVPMFNAAFDIRYECHPKPPSLSAMDPTLADMFTTTDCALDPFLRSFRLTFMKGTSA